MKIRVGILENDQIYLSRLTQYFTTNYVEQIELSIFEDLKMFQDFIKKTKVDVFLANPDLVSDDLQLPKTIIMGFLSDNPQADMIDDIKVVFKYQNANIIYREIVNLYAELDSRTSYKETEGGAPVYLFMGAAGGTGTTTVAIACAASLAGFGKKVLYLNLEENGVVSPFLHGEGNWSLSDVLYAAKSNANLLLKMQSMVRVSEEGIYYYEPFTLPLDAHELTEQNLLDIIKILSTYEAYDCIIIDSDSVHLWKRNLLMKLAKYIFIVDNGTEISNGKLEKTVQEIAISDDIEEERMLQKVRIIYNRITSSNYKRIPSEYESLVYGEIEAFSRNHPRKVMEEIAKRPFFDSLV